MVDLLDGYVGSSCVIKAKNNDLISMGVLHRIGKNFIDVSSSRNELPGIPYNLLIKLEIYNTQLGFKVLLGRVYLSSPKLVRIVELSEATNDERREYFRISTRDEGIIYNCIRGNDTLDMGEESEDYNGLKVRLVDISLGGLMFCTREEFKVNDRFNIVIPAMGIPCCSYVKYAAGWNARRGAMAMAANSWKWPQSRRTCCTGIFSDGRGSAAENTVGQRDERRDC